MEVSPVIKTSQTSLPSPDGLHLATLNGTTLEISRIPSLELVRSISVPPSSAKFLQLRWSPAVRGAGASSRILLANESTVRVWDLDDHDWSASIDNGSGGLGPISSVEFGGDDSEVLVFSSFGAQVTCWSLWTGRSVEIKDPKFIAKGHGRSRLGRSGIFALLSRPAAQDIVSLHVAESYDVMKSFSLPTVDVQGLKWSPDGRWFTVWDTPSTGFKVFIYTADGHLYRCYTGDYFDDDLMGLGVKSIEWSPSGDFLAVGGYENTVILLSTRTFSPAVYLAHAPTVRPTSTTIHLEQVHSASHRSYTSSHVPFSPPTAGAAVSHISPSSSSTENSTASKIGTSILTFNSGGNLMATKSDAYPTTVWIWDLANLSSRAVLVQHSVIKKLMWHPTRSELLFIQCNQSEGFVYLWNGNKTIQDEKGPSVFNITLHLEASPRAQSRWIYGGQDKKPIFLFGDAQESVLAYPEGREQGQSTGISDNSSTSGVGNGAPPTNGAEEENDDSLFAALSGKRSPEANAEKVGMKGGLGENTETATGAVDDTFAYLKGVGVH